MTVELLLGGGELSWTITDRLEQDSIGVVGARHSEEER
jgi:hypothetical protein